MHRLVFIATALLSVSSTACHKAPTGVRPYPENMGITGPPPTPQGIAAVVFEHAMELALTESQYAAIAVLRKQQDSLNAPRQKSLDSLRPVRRPANGALDLSQEQREEIETRRAAIASVLDAWYETNAAIRVKIMALLTPAQQKRAGEFEEDAFKRADEEGKRRASAAFVGDQEQMRRGTGRPQEE